MSLSYAKVQKAQTFISMLLLKNQKLQVLWEKMSAKEKRVILEKIEGFLQQYDILNSSNLLLKSEFENFVAEKLEKLCQESILPPIYDNVFKAIFLSDKPNYVLLKDLMKWTIFDGAYEIEDLQVCSQELLGERWNERRFIMDLCIQISTTEQCNIEIQL